MTFVYRNTARLLYTRRPIAAASEAPRFGNNLCNWDIPWMRERTDVAGIQIGIGIQRILVYRARLRMGAPLRARSQPVYTMYGFALSYTYDSSSTTLRARMYRARRWCTYQVHRTSADRETKAKSTADRYSHCRLRVSGTVHPILQSVPYPVHLIASLRRFRCNLSLRHSRNEAYRKDEATRMR